jgi:hypothetical protein
MFVFGLLIYVGTYLVVQHRMVDMAVTPQMIAELEQFTNNIYAVHTPEDYIKTVAMLTAQTTLTAFLSLSGILLMLFAAPSTPWLAVAAERVQSKLPLVAAALLALVFVCVVLISPLSQAFELVPLPLWAYLVVGLETIIWMLVQRAAWRGRWLERFLEIDL